MKFALVFGALSICHGYYFLDSTILLSAMGWIFEKCKDNRAMKIANRVVAYVGEIYSVKLDSSEIALLIEYMGPYSAAELFYTCADSGATAFALMNFNVGEVRNWQPRTEYPAVRGLRVDEFRSLSALASVRERPVAYVGRLPPPTKKGVPFVAVLLSESCVVETSHLYLCEDFDAAARVLSGLKAKVKNWEPNLRKRGLPIEPLEYGEFQYAELLASVAVQLPDDEEEG
ncbi:hypothetical protein [Comamonas sp. UBA7528]|uniref:hypothetical protein n=1 Tax=Comamonas sp. UBA7528 TaxID=1946391 RepID=UPI0025C0F975|nr:hypothetical protein [Comamonas sp. UBA7528]